MQVQFELKSYGKTVARLETTYSLADKMKMALRRVFNNPEHVEITDSRDSVEGRKAAEIWLNRERELRR